VKVCPVCQREYPAEASHCADDRVPLVAMVTDTGGGSKELIGQIVEGRYKIERIIGQGGMGTVYACRHVVVGKVAAMKVIRTGAERSEGVLQRFVREAQTANLLHTRHIVEVSDFGQLPSGAFFVVMELLEGQDLAHAMRAGLSRKDLVHIFTQIAETLQLAHDKGIVHRDLKPDNVFLVNDGGDPLFVKLLDFGIAKVLHGEGTGGLTETGVILGTPYYMSPEQARADALDHRSDIYSLGVMMYRAFTGRLPFVADSTMGVLTRHITEAPQPPSQIGNVDQVTEQLILRCLAKRPQYRYQSMSELAEALKQVPLQAAPSLRDHPTVLEGPTPGAQRAQLGIAATQSAAHPQVASGAHPQVHSGPYAPVPSGPYAQVPSGPYAQVPSGPYAQVPSGPYTQVPSGPHAQVPSGPHAQAPSGPYAPVPSGPYAPVPSGPYAPVPSGPHLQVPSGAYAAAPGYAPVPAGVPLAVPVEIATTRGVAATAEPAPARGSNGLMLLVGGLGMAAIGAAAAFFLLWRPAPVRVPADGATAAPVNAAAATATAVAAVTATPSATASAAEPAPSAAAAKARVGGPLRPAPAAPTAAAAAKHPRDIRSPFD
jgi:eukaryotic-like serine/threonine-protein kinase